MSCLPTFPDAPVFAFDEVHEAGPLCTAGAVDVAGRGAFVFPDAAIAQTLDLQRARVGLGIASGPVRARVRTGAVRSADEDSYIGVAGEAWVAVVEQAAVGGAWRGFSGEVGLVPDPWVAAGDRAWGLDALAPTFAAEAGWIAPSDAGAAAAWRGLDDRVGVDVTLVSGEGANRRERNEGKDLAGSVAVAPLGTPALVVSAYGRNGSRGLGYVPAHRAGLRAAGELARVSWGAEGLMAWGVGDEAERAPISGSAWLRAQPIGPLLVAVRADAWTEALGEADARSLRGLAGLGARVEVPGGAFVALGGVDHSSLGDGVAPFAGAPAAASSTTVYVYAGLELGVRAEAP